MLAKELRSKWIAIACGGGVPNLVSLMPLSAPFPTRVKQGSNSESLSTLPALYR